ncbi:MAG: polyisoprenyl-teichoic acid--peptidoglycan teichoic acid transferase [Actinomycetota bacterium]
MKQGLRTPGAPRRSGAVAAFLSFIFPGLGQAYLGDRRRALMFAAPVIAVIGIAVLVLLLNRSAAVRILDPSVSFALAIVVILLAIWWFAAVLHAWQRGWHVGTASAAIAIALVLAIGVGGAWGAVYFWRIHNGSEEIFTGNPFDKTPPPPTPSPTPLPSGETPDPLATPTPRPPDYNNPSDDPSNEPTPSIEPGETPDFDITKIDAQGDGILNVLLVGIDWQPGRSSKRTDTILVVSANPDTGKVLMFSFPRDSARIPLYNGGIFNGKINTFAGFANGNPEVYPEGGLKALAFEVGYLLGMPIDYYASVNMPGFMAVVEQVGGITVNNTRSINDDNLQFYLEPGTYRLTPEDALRYVRSRHGSGGDFGRAERQQQVLSALRKEILKPENIANLPSIVEAMSQVINTDFPPSQIDQLVQLADQVQSEVSESWIFGYPEWATHLRARFTCGRSVQFLRLDKIAALSIELFGEKSLWSGKTPPVVGPKECDAESPTPTP